MAKKNYCNSATLRYGKNYKHRNMVEVFKTNVNDTSHAAMLIRMIHQTFPYLNANFDLHDHDNILRVKSTAGLIEPALLINMLNTYGFDAEVLPDEVNVTAK